MGDVILKKDWYRVEEVARLFDMSVRSIYRWIENEDLEARKLPNGQYRVSRDAIKKVLENEDEKV